MRFRGSDRTAPEEQAVTTGAKHITFFTAFSTAVRTVFMTAPEPKAFLFTHFHF